MGGKPCIRGLSITEGTVVGLINRGSRHGRILQSYPLMERADTDEGGSWLPDTCRLRRSCDNQRCAVAWLWR